MPGFWFPRRARWRPELNLGVAVLLVLPLCLALALFVVWPLVQLGTASVSKNGPREYLHFFRSRASVRALTFTLWQSAIVTALAVMFGAVLAWSLRTTRSRMARMVFWSAVLVPVWMGVVVKNYAFVIILGHNGIVNSTLRAVGLVSAPVDLLYTPAAIITGMLYTMLPYAVVPLYVAFLSIDPTLISAAESLGASRLRAMSSVALPLALPGLLATTAIVFVVSIGFYVTPVVLGGARGTFLSTLVQDDLFFRFDYASAAASGTLLTVLAAVILALAWRVVGRKRLERAIA